MRIALQHLRCFSLSLSGHQFDGWREGSLWAPAKGGPIISVTNILLPIGGKAAGGATSNTAHHASFRDHVHFVRRAVFRSPLGQSSGGSPLLARGRAYGALALAPSNSASLALAAVTEYADNKSNGGLLCLPRAVPTELSHPPQRIASNLSSRASTVKTAQRMSNGGLLCMQRGRADGALQQRPRSCTYSHTVACFLRPSDFLSTKQLYSQCAAGIWSMTFENIGVVTSV